MIWYNIDTERKKNIYTAESNIGIDYNIFVNNGISQVTGYAAEGCRKIIAVKYLTVIFYTFAWKWGWIFIFLTFFITALSGWRTFGSKDSIFEYKSHTDEHKNCGQCEFPKHFEREDTLTEKQESNTGCDAYNVKHFYLWAEKLNKTGDDKEESPPTVKEKVDVGNTEWVKADHYTENDE